MPSERKTRVLMRWLSMIELLSAAGSRGVAKEEFRSSTGVSLKTFYRDLKQLRDAGLEIDSGEAGATHVYRFSRERCFTRGLDAKQRASLRTIRRSLARLAGTPITNVLDALLTSKSEGPAAEGPSGPQKAGASASVIEALERALAHRKRLTFSYRGDKDGQFQERQVEPIEMRLEGTQLYLLAWDLEAQALKTFKPARMQRARVEPEACTKRDVDLNDRLRHSVRIWDGAAVQVVIRVAGSKARYLHEWPLRDDQHVDEQPDGSVFVRATVAGNVEALRWVLSWGAAAEVIAPAELRTLVAGELRQALKPYAEKVKGARTRRSHGS